MKVFQDADGVKDQCITMHVKMPMQKAVAIVVRMVTIRNFPKVGDWSWVYVPWDMEKDCVSDKKQEGASGNGLVRANPTDPNKSCALVRTPPRLCLPFLTSIDIPSPLLPLPISTRASPLLPLPISAANIHTCHRCVRYCHQPGCPIFF